MKPVEVPAPGASEGRPALVGTLGTPVAPPGTPVAPLGRRLAPLGRLREPLGSVRDPVGGAPAIGTFLLASLVTSRTVARMPPTITTSAISSETAPLPPLRERDGEATRGPCCCGALGWYGGGAG